MNPKKLNPSESDLYNSATDSMKWMNVFGMHNSAPEGWKTREEIGKMLNLGKSQTAINLQQAVNEGTVECKDFFIFRNGKKRKVPHYFVK